MGLTIIIDGCSAEKSGFHITVDARRNLEDVVTEGADLSRLNRSDLILNLLHDGDLHVLLFLAAFNRRFDDLQRQFLLWELEPRHI